MQMIGTVQALNKYFEHIPYWAIALLARFIVGLVFYRSGLTKIDGFAIKDSTFFLFATEFKVPLLPPVFAAYMATATELTMSSLLFAGFFTRFAATALLGMTLVIEIFVYPQAWPTHIQWAAMLLVLLCRGPGSLSIDHWLWRRVGSTQSTGSVPFISSSEGQRLP